MNSEDNAAIVEKYILGRGLDFARSKRHGDVVFDGEVSMIFGAGNVHVSIIVKDDRIASITSLPSSDTNCIVESAKFLSWANKFVQFGSFDIDWNDGSISFRLAYPACLLHSAKTREYVRDLFDFGWTTYYPHRAALSEVRQGLSTADEAIMKAKTRFASLFSNPGNADGKDATNE